MTAQNIRFCILLAIATFPLISSCREGSKAEPSVYSSPVQNGQRDGAGNFGLDKSPMDMCYYPTDYPIRKMSGNYTTLPVVRVIYSRPRKSGRAIFGDVVQYGQQWRLGANEATEIEFFQDVTIMGERVLKGRYVLYCIPEAAKWKIVLNTDYFTWGLKINPKYDAYSFEVPTASTPTPIEFFTMDFQKSETGFSLLIAWDSTRVEIPMTVSSGKIL